MFTVDARQRLGTLSVGGAFRRHVDRHGAHELAAAAALAGRCGAAAVGPRDRLQGGPATSVQSGNDRAGGGEAVEMRHSCSSPAEQQTQAEAQQHGDATYDTAAGKMKK